MNDTTRIRLTGRGRRVLRFGALILGLVLVAGAGAAAIVYANLATTLSSRAVDLDGQGKTVPDISEYEGGFNLLVTGVDACEEEYAALFGDRCSGGDSQSTLNDVNLLVHVSEEPRRITVVSFPRDLMVPIPECEDGSGGSSSAVAKQALNSSYGRGGLACVARTITELTGQSIEFAAAVTFGGVIEITDAIGGVDVCVANGIDDVNTGLHLAAGTHTLKGLDALQFLRTRYGVGDGSDLGRIGNQQQYLSSLVRTLIDAKTLSDIPTMLKLADVGVRNITPSTSLADPQVIVQLALAVKDVAVEDIVFVQYPNVVDPENPNRVVPDEANAAVLWEAVNANRQLQVTHEPNAQDGVVAQPGSPTSPSEETPSPGADIEMLPEAIKGNSADQRTCSNGNVE